MNVAWTFGADGTPVRTVIEDEEIDNWPGENRPE